MNQYICIDIGGSAIKHALIKKDGAILSSALTKTPKTLEDLVSTIQEIQNMYSQEITQGIAISMPGVIDSSSGHAVHGGALSYILDLNVKELISNACKVPVQVENDGKCAALGEHWQGNLVGVENGIALVIGTGIGGGIIVHNKLLRGQHFSAGEFSFIQTNSESEDFKYVFAVQGSSTMLSNTYANLKNIEEDSMNGKLFFEDVNNGVPEAINLLQSYTEKLTKQIFNLQTVLDPEVITIGGGISCQPVLFDYINQHIEQTLKLTPIPIVPPNVKQSSLGNQANLLGALANFIEKENMK